MRRMLLTGLIWSVLTASAGWPSAQRLDAADPPVKKIAPTVAEALKVFDPSKFSLLKTAKPIKHFQPGRFHYLARETDVKAAFEFHRKDLAKLKWKELPNSTVDETSCSGTFSKDRYLITLMTMPSGEKGAVGVMFFNHSNLDLKKLPVPKGAKSLYSFPNNEAYVTAQKLEDTVAEVTNLLRTNGWEPYGTAGDQHFFRQNAVQLSANIMTAPAQGNKTAITYSAEQLSTELPAPAKTVMLQYSDSTKRLLFDYDAEELDQAYGSMHKFYNDSLGQLGWKPTTEQPIEDGAKQMLIYRNAAKDMLTMYLYVFDGRLRVEIEHLSGAEVAEIDAAAKLAAAKRKAEIEAEEKARSQPKPKAAKLSLTLPVEAKDMQIEKEEVKFKLGMGKGKAKAFAESLIKKLKADGWKERGPATLDVMVGVAHLEKGEQSVRINYLETGIFPAEVTISGDDLELEVVKQK